jgi:hypothetical protein
MKRVRKNPEAVAPDEDFPAGDLGAVGVEATSPFVTPERDVVLTPFYVPVLMRVACCLDRSHFLSQMKVEVLGS